MVDPRLAELRRAKSLRLGGMAYTGIGDRMGYPWQTIRKRIAEANELRAKGLLYADLNAEEDDMYAPARLDAGAKRLTIVNGAT